MQEICRSSESLSKTTSQIKYKNWYNFESANMGKKVDKNSAITIFQQFFAKIDKNFNFDGRLGTKLQFYNVVKFS